MASGKNYSLNKFAGAKSVLIPITITPHLTPGSQVYTVDDEVQDGVEIFNAPSTAAGVDGVKNNVAAAFGSVLDPSANDVNGKAFPANLTGTAAACTLGFVIVDGETEKQPVNIPLPSDGRNPSYGTPAIVGTAKKFLGGTLTLQDQTSFQVYTGMPIRTETLTAGITPNGNLKFRVMFQTFPIATTGPTMKGFLELFYL